MSLFFKRLYRLTLLAVLGPQAWVGLLLYGTVLGFSFVGVWASIQMISWSKRFYDAVEQLDLDTTLREMGYFFALIALQAALSLVGQYLRDRLMLRWRGRLTDQALQVWVQNQAYWHLRPGLSPKAVDNPDQRVAQDCRLFVDKLLILSLDLIENCVSIFSYVAVLWGLTSFVLTLTVFGTEIGVGHYLVWIAFLYVGISTLITHWLGHPLKGLFFAQEKREADFRYALVQLRDNASEIAQSGGEQAEQRRLQDRFSRIRSNWHDLILREAILNLFRRPYYYTAIRSALFFSLPAYFAGFVTFGGLMQLSGAFSRVTSTLSWFIFNYPSLAEIAAVAERLDELFTSANDPEPMPDAQVQISQNVSNDGGLHLSGVALSTPLGRALAPVPDASVQPTEAVWISGASGSGKSTLVGAIAGLWRYGQGQIQRPAAGMMVLPQRPYLLPDGLAQAACYPRDPSDFDPEQITQVLIRVGLENRLPMLQVAGPQAIEGLSMGERQRLAFARVLLNRPHWVVLDEATSALDAQAEAELLALLRSELPGAAILCVSHSAPHALGSYATWQIGGITPARAVG